MSAPEFDDFAALWTQEPSADERRVLASLARGVGRRAKLFYYLNLGLAFFLAIGLSALLLLDRTPATAILVILVLAALGWSSWKRHQAEQVALILDRTDRVSFIEGAIKATNARLRNSRLAMLLLLPGFFLGLAIRGTRATDFEHFLQALQDKLEQPSVQAGAAVVFLLFVYLVRQTLLLQKESRALGSLRDEYSRQRTADANEDILLGRNG